MFDFLKKKKEEPATDGVMLPPMGDAAHGADDFATLVEALREALATHDGQIRHADQDDVIDAALDAIVNSPATRPPVRSFTLLNRGQILASGVVFEDDVVYLRWTDGGEERFSTVAQLEAVHGSGSMELAFYRPSGDEESFELPDLGEPSLSIIPPQPNLVIEHDGLREATQGLLNAGTEVTLSSLAQASDRSEVTVKRWVQKEVGKDGFAEFFTQINARDSPVEMEIS
jgi:hypothetical protein